MSCPGYGEGCLTSSQEPKWVQVGQRGPDTPSHQRHQPPNKTLHYWKPSQAEGVEVAMWQETVQGQPGLSPRSQQPVD